jgi:hypothetical protein
MNIHSSLLLTSPFTIKAKVYLRNNPFLPQGTTTMLDLSQFYKDNSSDKAGRERWAMGQG